MRILKNHISLIVAILITVPAILLLKFPVEKIFSLFNFNRETIHFLSGAIPRILIILFSFFIIKINSRLTTITNPYFSLKFKNPHVLIIPLMIFSLAAFQNIINLINVNNGMITFFILEKLIIGFSEEIVFRGIILCLFSEILAHKRFCGIYSVLLSSLLFGLMHYINYFKIWNIEEVSSQVIFAFALGCLFGGIFLRTATIYSVIILHTLFNVGFANDYVQNQDINTLIDQPDSFSSILLGWIILAVLIFCGLYMSRPSKTLRY